MSGNYSDLIHFENVITEDNFKNWTSLDDSIMGGSSFSKCISTPNGLLIKGKLVEEAGGFISCRSDIFSPPLDLSKYHGLCIEVEGKGRDLKFSVACNYKSLSFLAGNIRWVRTFSTQDFGLTRYILYFKDLIPTIRAKKVSIPLMLNKKSIIRLQLLYSKFDIDKELNKNFKSGSFEILLKSIKAFKKIL